jgi:hypothetical protein
MLPLLVLRFGQVPDLGSNADGNFASEAIYLAYSTIKRQWSLNDPDYST